MECIFTSSPFRTNPNPSFFAGSANATYKEEPEEESEEEDGEGRELNTILDRTLM